MKIQRISKIVGTNLRAKRRSLGMSAQVLSKELGISYQQVCKYEKGIDRLSADTLFKLSQILRVDVRYFFNGCGDYEVNSVIDKLPQSHAQALLTAETKEISRELFSLAQAYSKIKDENLRSEVLSFIKKLQNM